MCTCNSSYLELARAISYLKKRPAYCLIVISFNFKSRLMMILQKYINFKTKMTMKL